MFTIRNNATILLVPCKLGLLMIGKVGSFVSNVWVILLLIACSCCWSSFQTNGVCLVFVVLCKLERGIRFPKSLCSYEYGRDTVMSSIFLCGSLLHKNRYL